MFSVLNLKQPLASADDLEKLVLQVGFLPYFAGSIKGFSVEELTSPSLLWELKDGPWSWKGEIVRRWNCAYGKFSRRKAAYISLDLFPHYLNYRRYIYTHYNKSTDYDTDSRLLALIKENESLLSRELKKLAGLTRPRTSGLSPLEKITGGKRPAADAGFDPAMARLQMGGQVVIADFEYDTDNKGNQRGWGIARYTTPEALYGDNIASAGCEPFESYDIIYERIASLGIPGISRREIDRMINF